MTIPFPVGPTTLGATANAATTANDALDRDDFLNILVTQLQNQDPLNPMEPNEFASQLAEFSSLEQLTNVNDAVRLLGNTQVLTALSVNTGLAASLIGKEVVAVGDQLAIAEGEKPSVIVDVSGNGGQATIRVMDENGTVVHEESLGPISGGRQELEFGADADLEPGTYTYEVVVTGPDESEVPVTTFTSGIVDGVHFEEDGIILTAGPLEIRLDQLAEIGLED